MVGGPRGTVYDITPNGWFDSRTSQKNKKITDIHALVHKIIAINVGKNLVNKIIWIDI